MTDVSLTPAKLEDRLRASGRVVHTRTLRSWYSVEKGLLPPPQRYGRGQGHGAIWFWQSPDVFEQACIVYDALEQNRRTDFAKWCLWWCGYDVSPNDIRRIWLKKFSKEKLDRKTAIGEFPSDKYEDVIEHFEKRIVRDQKIDESSARELSRAIILAIQEPMNGKLNRDELSELSDELPRIFNVFANPTGVPINITAGQLEKYWPFVKLLIAIDAKRRLLESVTDNELVTAQQYLRKLGQFLQSITEAANSAAETSDFLLRYKLALVSTLSPPIFRVILLLIKSGNLERLEATASWLEKLTEESKNYQKHRLEGSGANNGPIYQAEGNAPLDELINVWKGFNWQAVYTSL